MTQIRMIVPRGAFGGDADDSELEIAIRIIAEAFKEEGEWAEKYGATVDNHMFSMHPYCWCESDDCSWCGHGAPNFLWKPTGGTVRWYKYIGRGMEVDGAFPADMLDAALSAHPGKPTVSELVDRMEAEAKESARAFQEWLDRGAPEDEM